MARGTDPRSMLATCAAVAAGITAGNAVSSLITHSWRSQLVTTWAGTTVALLVLAVGSAAHRGPLPRVLRQALGIGAAAAAGWLFLGFSFWLWRLAASSAARSSQLVLHRFDIVVRHEAVPAVICAALALALLTDGAGLVPGRRDRWGVALLTGAAGAVAAAIVGISQEFVQQGESLQRTPIPVLACSGLAVVVLVAAAAAGRVRASDALVLLAGAVLVYLAGTVLAEALTGTADLLRSLKQVLPAIAAAALALAAAPALRRHEPSV